MLLLKNIPKIIQNQKDKFKTKLFLNTDNQRKGGSRIKGLFKHSYKKISDDWWITNGNNENVEKVSLPESVSEYNELPLVTVITVVYNGEKYIKRTIRSIINQTYPNIEYIIIDGGSTDGTVDIIKKYEEYIDYWVSERDMGIYDAMNKGTILANGKWLNYMNAGDMFHESNTITDLSLALHDDYDIVYGNILVVDDIAKRRIVYRPKEWDMKSFYKGMPIFHQGLFVNIGLIKKYGYYDDTYRLSGDYEWLLRLFLNGAKTVYHDIIVSDFLADGASFGFRNKLENVKIAFKYFPLHQKLWSVLKLLESYVRIFILKKVVNRKLHGTYRRLKHSLSWGKYIKS